MRKPDDSGVVPVVALIEAFLAGEISANAFSTVYVLLYPRQDSFCTPHAIMLQEPLWMAAEDFGEAPGPTEDELRAVAQSVLDVLIPLAKRATQF